MEIVVKSNLTTLETFEGRWFLLSWNFKLWAHVLAELIVQFQKGSTTAWKKTTMMNISTQSKQFVVFWNERNKPHPPVAHSPNKKYFCVKQIGQNWSHQMNNCDVSWKYVLKHNPNQIDEKKKAKDHDFDTHLQFQYTVTLSKIILFLYALWISTSNETLPIELHEKVLVKHNSISVVGKVAIKTKKSWMG